MAATCQHSCYRGHSVAMLALCAPASTSLLSVTGLAAAQRAGRRCTTTSTGAAGHVVLPSSSLRTVHILQPATSSSSSSRSSGSSSSGRTRSSGRTQRPAKAAAATAAAASASGGGNAGLQFPPYTVVLKGTTYDLRLYDVHPAVVTEYSKRDEGYLALGSYFDGFGNAGGVRFAESQPVVMTYYPDVRSSRDLTGWV